MTLSVDDFGSFFEEVHGYAPFPWQARLLREVAERGCWHPVLDLPTGSGKTAAIDIAVFHLALESERGSARRAPVRIAFVVDRRLVVDDAYERARTLEEALRAPKGPVSERVARRLRALSADDEPHAAPLLARRLRGGIPRESDWARTPTQPTVICSTVDQIGSRLLFRGYGVSDSMKPVHAGLIGSDCLVLLDEAHLAEPFRQTLGWLARYHDESWRQQPFAPPWTFALLTATPGASSVDRFALDGSDFEHPVLSKRLEASKPVRLIAPVKTSSDAEEVETRVATARDDVAQRVRAIVAELKVARRHFTDAQNGATAPAIAIVVNRVSRARAVHAALMKELADEIVACQIAEPMLMIGAARSLDRDRLAEELRPIRTRVWRDGEARKLDMAMIIVATQCIEAGVDIDLDALITESAPIDTLRQRCGRLNRAGRDVRVFASVVAMSSELATRFEDPVYGKAIKPAWDYLSKIAKKAKSSPSIVDLGLSAFAAHERAHPIPAAAISEKEDAPVLLPAHVDLLSQTSPVPAPDPDVALFLHGPVRQPNSVSVVWRADVDPNIDVRGVLSLAPPRSSEAIELPVWAVRRWLMGGGATDLADVVAPAPEDGQGRISEETVRQAFLWNGDYDTSRWITPEEVYPGATLVVPTSYGGLDRFGWNPIVRGASSVNDDGSESVTDLGREAALAFRGRRFVVRMAPGLIGAADSASLAAVLAERREARWSELRDELLGLPLPETVRVDLEALDGARRQRVIAYTDLYGDDKDGRPRGVVFLAPLGIVDGPDRDDFQPSSTEDDATGSLPGFTLTLEKHSQDVERYAERFARTAGLPDVHVADLKLAGYLHDAGKRDRRFQAWLQYGDPLGPDADVVLAKSARRLPRKARSASGLPERWRHEALSVRIARANERVATANDPMLVLWLVGTHHGFGRPFFPHQDPQERAPEVGPQSLAFEWNGLDWATMFEHLKARYGPWELARMEAILRLADHRASEARAREAV